MKRLRRNYVPGGTYFFTVVTHHRQPILTTDFGRRCLREAIADQQLRRPFELTAVVLLPDHLHTIWALPHGDDDYSLRWSQIKEHVTRQFQTTHRIWQHRFWEHTITSEDDLKRCLDYIHWNPVKHGLATRPVDYPWSSFLKWVNRGEYDGDWGCECPTIAGAEWDM